MCAEAKRPHVAGTWRTEFELKSFVKSIEYLTEALNSNVQPLNNTQHQETEDLIRRAQQHVARLQLRVSPPHAEINVDRVLVPRVPGRPSLIGSEGSMELTVSEGPRDIEVFANAYVAQQRRVDARGGGKLQLFVELQPETPRPPIARSQESICDWDSVAPVWLAAISCRAFHDLRACDLTADLVWRIPYMSD